MIFNIFLATSELGDPGIDLQRLQIAQKETNMCLIKEGHNPTYELVLFPTPPTLNLNLIKLLEKPIYRKYKRQKNMPIFSKIQAPCNSV